MTDTGLPTYVVEIAFNLDPPAGTFKLDTSTLDGTDTLGAGWWPADFQSIPLVQDINIRRGRQDETGQIQAGECTVTLDNTTGDLSPENAGSIYFPNVLPGRRLRVSAVFGGVTYYLFYGMIESYTPVDAGPLSADMQIKAVDWLSWANVAELNTTYPAQTDAARVTAVLAAVTTPDMTTWVDAPSDNLLASTLTDEPALSHLQKVVEATLGLLYVRADGTIVWESRHYRQTAARCVTNQLVLGQPVNGVYVGGALPFVDLEYVFDNRDIRNDIRITATGTSEGTQLASDATSQALYGPRTLRVDSDVMGAGEASYQAAWLLSIYKDPTPRVYNVQVDPDADTRLWAAMLSREISDRIHVTKNLPGQVHFDNDMFIEGIQHTIKPQESHLVTLQLSDARLTGSETYRLDISALDNPAAPLTY